MPPYEVTPMEPESRAPLLAAVAVIVGGWALFGALFVGLSHLRMARVEAATQRRALPPDERALLWYALASLVWVSAAIVALVGVVKRDWARVGRNATILLVLHVGAAVAAATACAFFNAGKGYDDSELPSARELYTLVVAACVIAPLNFLAASGFAWAWAGRRRDRLRSVAPVQAPGPGAWRFALYVGSFLFWPAGFVALAVMSSPAEVPVGTQAFRLSLANVALVALAVCALLPIAFAAFALR